MQRQTRWVAIAPTNTNLAAISTAVLFGGFSSDILAQRPFTIVRNHVFFRVSSDQSATPELYLAAIGFAVVTSQALAIGVTAVPTPFTDQVSDAFFVWGQLGGTIDVATAVGKTELGKDMQIDSKAMRKVDDGFDVAISVETAPIGEGADVVKSGRMLIKLH